MHRHIRILPLILIAACGGGGGGAPPQPGGNPDPNGWVSGVYMPSDSFVAECASPRSGTDPDSGLPFPDVQGSALSENNWLRSWSNETYLWYDEIVDRNPAGPSTADYFAQLRTFALTASGNPKDRFHFTVPTAEWRQLSQSGTSAGYGVEFVSLANAPPRELIVAFTEPGSPAATSPANLARGARILSVDGVDFVNASDPASINTFSAGLFPADAGETHSFSVSDFDGSNTRTFSMTSAIVGSDPVRNVETFDTPSGRVGYLTFNDHIATAEQELVTAFNQLVADDIDDLVLDLRYNPGGFLILASQLSYMIAGSVPTAGRIFEATEFSDKHPSTNPITGQPLQPIPFIDETVGLSALSGQALPTLDLPRVYVLVGGNTCSASESIINGLRGVGVEVLLFGSATCGKPYGFYPTDNCGTTYFTIQFRGVNEAGFGDYADGFSPADGATPSATELPGCSIDDDLSRPLGDPLEARLAAALSYRNTAACPTPAAFSSRLSTTSAADSAGGAARELARLLRPPWRERRILNQ